MSFLDKFEYRVRAEEIQALVDEKDFKRAAELADTIDWRRVKSVVMLCTVSDVYKAVRRYDDSKALLLLAYDRRPGSRMIVYSLCELCIKTDDIVHAWEYYKEFVKVANNDSGKYVLLYKLYEAQDVSLEERISVLEELKRREYRDKWAYELAYLYHRIGFATKCVEECDEMVIFFGEGKYVRKALELKMLHEPLTPEQKEIYEGESGVIPEEENYTKVIPDLESAILRETDNRMVSDAPTTEILPKELEEIQVKTMDMGQYNTINLQKELAASMKEIMAAAGEEQQQEIFFAEENEEEEPFDGQDNVESDDSSSTETIAQRVMSPLFQETKKIPPIPTTTQKMPDAEEIFFEEPDTGDMSEALKDITMQTAETYAKVKQAQDDETAKLVMQAMKKETTDDEDVVQEVERALQEDDNTAKNVIPFQAVAGTNEGTIQEITEEKSDPYAGFRGTVIYPQNAIQEDKTGFEDILSQEYDGQISLVMPESEQIEKQITGQISIEDIMREWERMKKENEEKRLADMKKRITSETKDMFEEFDETRKASMLQELQVKADAAIEEEARKAKEKEEQELEAEETLETDLPDDTEQAEEMQETVADETLEEAEEATTEESEPQEQTDDIQDKGNNDVSSIDNSGSRNGSLTREQKELFGPYLQDKKSKEQIEHALEAMTLAAYTGNVLITGEEGVGTMSLAKKLVKEVQTTDANFSGRVAKISGSALNGKKMTSILEKVQNGALIVDEAGGMSCSTAEGMVQALEKEQNGVLVFLTDTKGGIDSLLKVNDVLKNVFNARVDIEALDDDSLVAFGRKFALEQEYSIDELGILALHTRIDELQTSDHAVTVGDVKSIVKEAIKHANKKNPKHFFDILFAKRYDKEDMIVLRENDFL